MVTLVSLVALLGPGPVKRPAFHTHRVSVRNSLSLVCWIN